MTHSLLSGNSNTLCIGYNWLYVVLFSREIILYRSWNTVKPRKGVLVFCVQVLGQIQQEVYELIRLQILHSNGKPTFQLGIS